MYETATDWRGQLRVGDLTRDSLRIVARRPLVAVILPFLVLGASRLLLRWVDVGALFSPWTDGGRWLNFWLDPNTLVAAPLLGMIWAALALNTQERVRPVDQLRRRGAAFAALSLGLASIFVILGALSFIGAIFIVGCCLLALPVCACEAAGLARSLRRGFQLARGTRLRVVAAWGLLQTMLLLAGVAVGLSTYVLVPEPFAYLSYREVDLIAGALELLYATLRISVTMALSVAAYQRLRRARVALDPESWIEVFA